MAVELEVTKNELQNTRALLVETSRLAERSSAQLARMSLEQQRSSREAAVVVTPKGNRIYTVLFPSGSSSIDLTHEAFDTLRAEAYGAALVVIRGRTDGTRETPTESRIARERAAKMQAMLVTAGIDATKIHISHQPVGDHVVSQETPQGRAQNRRVEVEIYTVKPTRTALNKGTV